jgi:uncharacterized protein YndB with AHSA1/START domain
VPDTATTAREIVLSRLFDAPRELVWEAFADPEQVVQWWGPAGFTNTLHEMDVRPGGIWRHTMHGPDGTDYPNIARYVEVVRPQRLVYELRADVPDAGEHFTATVTLEEREGGTEVTMRMLFPDAESRDAVAGYAIEGGNQTLARLAEHLEATAAQKR